MLPRSHERAITLDSRHHQWTLVAEGDRHEKILRQTDRSASALHRSWHQCFLAAMKERSLWTLAIINGLWLLRVIAMRRFSGRRIDLHQPFIDRGTNASSQP